MKAAKIKAIAPWFGGKRTMAPAIVEELWPHTQYFEPCCGSMAVLFAKEPAQKETVNDLHGDLINLGRVLQDPIEAPKLYDRLQAPLFSDDVLAQARYAIDGDFPPGVTTFDADRAFWYFVASWMGRNGTAGTERIDYQLAVRWTKSGGSSTIRWRNAVESIPWWHDRLRNVVILRRDAFALLPKFEDSPATAIYVDPPYHAGTRSAYVGGGKERGSGRYLHEFEHDLPLLEDDHRRLARLLNGYRHARVVVSYYDCPEIRELYKGWTFVDHMRQKHLHAQNGRGARPKDAPEVLIINGPSYAVET